MYFSNRNPQTRQPLTKILLNEVLESPGSALPRTEGTIIYLFFKKYI